MQGYQSQILLRRARKCHNRQLSFGRFTLNVIFLKNHQNSSWALEQVDQRSQEISVLRDIQDSASQRCIWLDPLWATVLLWLGQRGWLENSGQDFYVSLIRMASGKQIKTCWQLCGPAWLYKLSRTEVQTDNCARSIVNAQWNKNWNRKTFRMASVNSRGKTLQVIRDVSAQLSLK